MTNTQKETHRVAQETGCTVSVLSLDLEDRTPANLLRFFRQALQRGSRLVMVPFGFPDLEGGSAESFFSSLAQEHRVHLVAGYLEDDRRVAAVFLPDGSVAGRYAQTHRLPDETFRTGDEIKPIATSLGSIGLSIGSDIFFPEVHWSLGQQGADFLVHLDIDRGINEHFYSVLSPKVRAFDLHRPVVVVAPSSCYLKLPHNEEMQLGGTPMSGSYIADQNGAVLASTGFSQGIATADLRLYQHCQSREQRVNLPISKGLDLWKLYFNDSRKRYFGPLKAPYAPTPKPPYSKRKIRVAVVTQTFFDDFDKASAALIDLIEGACAMKPDIVVCTEMWYEWRPEEPRVAKAFERMAEITSAAGAYLLIGGIRCHKPGTKADRASHGWLWDRSGNRVFESIIMLYGRGCGQGYFDTDFGRIGIRLCGDVYAPELDRLFALEDVDIVFNPSQSWGASGLINTELNQVRAMDNGHFVVSSHTAFSDPGQRSHVIDPMGFVVAASSFYCDDFLVADIDLDGKRGIFVKEGTRGEIKSDAYLRRYRTLDYRRLLSRPEIMNLRRPELYAMIDEDVPNHPFTTRDRGDGCYIPPKE
ncbi:MAG TPA: carbon-nitrogen hydrolase family protein [Chthoniobacteraceae bacterium]|nr:carbon-nitrogen hydrolase family protein [Chthoniobacteraceae bacterium]